MNRRKVYKEQQDLWVPLDPGGLGTMRPVKVCNLQKPALGFLSVKKLTILLQLILFTLTIKTVRAEKEDKIFLLTYFLGNGETGIFLTYSFDGLKFDWLNKGKQILMAPEWRKESLTRDPSILYHNGIFHMVWTTSWKSRSIGYAYSENLRDWSEPKKIKIWRKRKDVRNTWAPELHWDPEEKEFLILWSSTIKSELNDNDGSKNSNKNDHRSYASRTKDFKEFTKPELFYTPLDPELSVIDPYIVRDDDNNRWVMVIKNEMPAHKNLCLVFSEKMQGPYETKPGPPIVGKHTKIVNTMGEGPSLLKVDGLWRLYWDAPGSRDYSYCVATSPDLKIWANESHKMELPVKRMRHGTVLRVPLSSIAEEWIKEIK